MKQTCLASLVLAALIASPAIAADMPLKAKAPPPPVSSWSGFYLGLGVGYRADESDAKLTASTFSQVGFPVINNLTGCGDLPCALSEPARGPAFRFAPYLGFNWQVAPRWVVGVEGDFGAARRTTTLNGMFLPGAPGFGTVNDSFVAKTTWDASARLRAGFLLDPSVLVYATGGAAWTRLETTSNCGNAPFAFGVVLSACATPVPALFNVNFFTPPTFAHATTRAGWTVGGGIEAALWSNWILRAEYRYADYGTFSATDVRTCAAPCLFGPGTTAAVVSNSYELHLRSHIANFGLAYKFGDPIAPVALGPTGGLYKAPPLALAPSWTGVYFGLGVGHRATNTTATVLSHSFAFGAAPAFDVLAGCTTCFTSEPLNDSSYRFSPYLGYLWQVGSIGVIGVEADWGLASQTTTFNGMYYPSSSAVVAGSANDTFAVKTDWDASVRARAGVLLTPTILAYATGGPAWIHVESTSTCSTNAVGHCAPIIGFGPGIITDTKNQIGWTVGGGFEVAFWQNFVARGEYRYSDYGTIHNTDARVCPSAACFGPVTETVRYDLRLRTHTATIGIAYRFNDAPVAAKY
jgi:outer membrane immunogenic protein